MISPPLTVKSPSTTALFLIVVVPLAAAICNVVALSAKLIVVGVVSKLKLAWSVIISPPCTFKSPVSSVIAELIVVVPVTSPMLITVAAPNAFTVCAVSLTKLNVVLKVLSVSPLTCKV